jgi:hypothetical protein
MGRRKAQEQNMVSVTFWLPAEDSSATQAIASAFRGMKHSDILRAAVRLFLREYPEKGPALLVEPVRPRMTPEEIQAASDRAPKDHDPSAGPVKNLKAERERIEAEEKAKAAAKKGKK